MDHLLIAITIIINSIRLSTVLAMDMVFQHNSDEVPFLLNVQAMKNRIKREPNNKKQFIRDDRRLTAQIGWKKPV
ncbi:hypothetical protein BDF22DRAFT_670783 [Syncephalis plumigaleata]|nr:hypothetical protein BDF22DRAFT_670783 [Syncephalis plumigaleata]